MKRALVSFFIGPAIIAVGVVILLGSSPEAWLGLKRPGHGLMLLGSLVWAISLIEVRQRRLAGAQPDWKRQAFIHAAALWLTLAMLAALWVVSLLKPIDLPVSWLVADVLVGVALLWSLLRLVMLKRTPPPNPPLPGSGPGV